MNCKIEFDISELDNQISRLNDIFSRSLEGFPEFIPGDLDSLLLDIVFGHGISTVGADGSLKITYGCRLGGDFESFVAAFGARKIDDIVHTSPRN